ncbi:hypothetical protein ACR71G_02150 [Xenorhabdus bovienii]|uniref:hypothetical protein n=1 Tax=Xenorhabdus bovienii TaxID=40576 RepID=UPI003DA478F5
MTILLDSPPDNVSLSLQWCGLAGSLIILGVHGWLFLKSRGVMACVVSMAGAIMIFIFADSLLFVAPKNTGVLNFGYLSAMTKISDAQCDGEMMVVKLAEKNEPTEWRCPQGFALLGDTSKPFIPWPNYTTGKSVELTSAIYTLMDSAIKPEQHKN